METIIVMKVEIHSYEYLEDLWGDDGAPQGWNTSLDSYLPDDRIIDVEACYRDGLLISSRNLQFRFYRGDTKIWISPEMIKRIFDDGGLFNLRTFPSCTDKLLNKFINIFFCIKGLIT